MLEQLSLWDLIISNLNIINNLCHSIDLCQANGENVALATFSFVTALTFLSVSTVWLCDSVDELRSTLWIWWNDVSDSNDSNSEEVFRIVLLSPSSSPLIEIEL